MGSVQFFLFLGWRSYLVLFYAGEKGAGELALSRIALAVNGAKIEEFVAERNWLFLLRKYPLQCESEFAKADGFRPLVPLRFPQMFIAGEEAFASLGALFKAGQELVAKSLRQQFQLTGFYFIAGVHRAP